MIKRNLKTAACIMSGFVIVDLSSVYFFGAKGLLLRDHLAFAWALIISAILFGSHANDELKKVKHR